LKIVSFSVLQVLTVVSILYPIEGIAGLWSSSEYPNVKSVMTIEQLRLVKRATKLAYPDSMEMEGGSLIKNPAAYEKLCKESIVTNCRKSHMEITKEELFDELTSMSKDELVKDFIYILDHQSALTSSNRELRSSSDSLRRRTKAYPDSLEMEDRSLINYPTAYAELMT
jgi:IS1 family transposase